MALQTQTFSAGDYAYQSWSNGYVISLTLTEESINTVNNTSLISYLFTISNTDNNRFTSNDYSWDISIGGQSIAIRHFNFNLANNYTTQTIASGQVTVSHDGDGSMNMPYSVSIPNVQNWTSYGPPAMSVSGNWPLTQILRQAEILTAEDFTDSQNPTITYSNPAGTAVDALQACISLTGQEADVPYRDIDPTGSVYTFTLSEAERNTLCNNTPGTSRVVYFFVRTIIGGVTYTSYLEKTFTVVLDNAWITGATNFTDETNPTVYYVNQDGIRVDKVEVCICNVGGTGLVGWKEVNRTQSSYTFNLSASEISALQSAARNTRQYPVEFYIRTTINGTATVSNFVSGVMHIVNADPTLTATVVDTNSLTAGLTGDAENKLVRYYSTAVATVTGNPKKGASISGYKITHDGNTYSTNQKTFNAVESGSFVFGVTDSRGNVAEQPVNKTLIPYVKLTCNLEDSKPDTDGNMTVRCTGNCFNGSFGAQANTLTTQYRFKVSGGSWIGGDSDGWHTMDNTKSGNTYVATATTSIPDFNYQSSYVLQARAIDKLVAVSTLEMTVKSTPVFDWSEKDFNFHVPVNFNAGTACGLGAALQPPVLTDIDNPPGIGWFYASASLGYDSSLPAPHFWGVVRNDTCGPNAVQTAYWFGSNLGQVLTRYRENGSWQPWEHVNPPMRLGVEYRTTERYLGKPIYTMTVECENFSEPDSVKTFEILTGVDKLVSSYATVANYQIPTKMYGTYNESGIVDVEVRVNGYGELGAMYATKTRDLTSKRPVITVKYTKLED